jgi:hypothetical protein
MQQVTGIARARSHCGREQHGRLGPTKVLIWDLNGKCHVMPNHPDGVSQHQSAPRSHKRQAKAPELKHAVPPRSPDKDNRYTSVAGFVGGGRGMLREMILEKGTKKRNKKKAQARASACLAFITFSEQNSKSLTAQRKRCIETAESVGESSQVNNNAPERSEPVT